MNPQRVITCFSEYMQQQGLRVTRAEFEQNLHGKQDNPAFLEDIKPLLSDDVSYNPQVAMTMVREALIDNLPGKPWRGEERLPSTVKRSGSRRSRK